MNKGLKVSVIMSVFNNESTIETCIKSILNQTFSDFEFLIVDDGSTDDTYNKMETIAKNDNRIIIYKNSKNIGLTKNLNRLIQNSKYPIIARQDADDFSLPNRFQKQIDFLQEKNLDGCSSRAKIIQTKKTIPNLSYYLPLKYIVKFKNPVIHGSIMLRKTILENIGLYNEKFYYAQDFKLLHDILDSGYKFKIMKEVLYNMNFVNNISSKYLHEQNKYKKHVLQKTEPNG